jgi:hypothetical protein
VHPPLGLSTTGKDTPASDPGIPRFRRMRFSPSGLTDGQPGLAWHERLNRPVQGITWRGQYADGPAAGNR